VKRCQDNTVSQNFPLEALEATHGVCKSAALCHGEWDGHGSIPKAWDVTMAQSFVIREIIRKK